MSSFALKLIAVLAMTADHAGALAFPQSVVLRLVGRLSFPIFAFLIAEGFQRTSDRKKYMLRLTIFAFVSEIPFDLAFSKADTLKERLLDFGNQNIFFTLAAGLLAVWCHEHFEKAGSRPAAYAAAAVCILGSALMVADYSLYGVALIYFIYLFRQKPAALALSVTVVNALICLDAVLANGAGEMRSYIQLAAIAAVPFMLLYNGRRGPRLKYLFYAYYPAHLLVLTFLAGRF